jgi:probable HAF family extracellular repeat protein
MLKNTKTLAVAVTLILGGASAQAHEYKFTVLPFPGGASILANGVNNQGQVVGTAYDQDGNDQAVVWHWGVQTVLQGLGGPSRPFAINRHGQSVGYAFSQNYGQQAVRWDGAIPTVLELPPEYWAVEAVAINAHGQVAGNAAVFNHPSQAVKWGAHGRAVILDSLGGWQSVASGINRAGDVVGFIWRPNGADVMKAVVWHGSVPTFLDVLYETQCCNQASAINDSGQIVGWSSAPGGGTVRAVVWNGTKPTALQALSDADHALAINNMQMAVGTADAGSVGQAALWNLTTGEGVDLNTYLTAAERSAGWTLTSARGINDRGVIVGFAFNTKIWSYFGFQLAPTSEP